MTRRDGRKYDTLRHMRIERDFIKYAEGSCFIEVGNTRIIVTATVDRNVPSFLKGKGMGWVTSEYGMLPRSTQSRILRDKVSGRSMEIQRLIGRALRSIIELKELGERTIWIDCDVLQADGGTRTASITAGFISLVFALENLRAQNQISQLPIRDYVAAISVGIVEDSYLLDLTYEEDSQAQVDMNVVMTGSGQFVEVQGTAEKTPFSKEKMQELLSLAKKGIDQLIQIQRGYLKSILLK